MEWKKEVMVYRKENLENVTLLRVNEYFKEPLFIIAVNTVL